MPDGETKNFDHSLIGSGEIAIIFLNGFGMKFDTWKEIVPGASSKYQLLFLNRLGIGASSRAVTKQTGAVVVSDLHEFFPHKIYRGHFYLSRIHLVGSLQTCMLVLIQKMLWGLFLLMQLIPMR